MPIRNDPELFNVYEYRVEDTQFKIIPIVKRGGTDWEIRIFRDYHQGAIWRGQKLSQKVIEELNLPVLPETKLEEINRAVSWANDLLDYDSSFNREKRGRASISDLTELTGMDLLVGQVDDRL